MTNSDNSLPSNAYLNHDVTFMAGEEWKPMDGQNWYNVSNLGRVLKSGSAGMKIISQKCNGKTGHSPRFLINRTWYSTPEVVASAFSVPNPLSLSVVGHVNGIKTDNRPANLFYGEMDSDALISPFVLCDWSKLEGMSASRVPVVKLLLSADSSVPVVRLAAYRSLLETNRSQDDKVIIFSEFKNVLNYYTFEHFRGGVFYVHLSDYLHLPSFKEQAQPYLDKNNNKVHPFLM